MEVSVGRETSSRYLVHSHERVSKVQSFHEGVVGALVVFDLLGLVRPVLNRFLLGLGFEFLLLGELIGGPHWERHV